MVHLFAQYYVPKDNFRRKEIDECFKRNIHNPLITSFTIFFEREEDLNVVDSHPKVKKILLFRRLKYSDWLNETNKLASGELSILINSDIYLNESINHLLENVPVIKKRQLFIALSRYNPIPFGFELNKNPHWTQDLWALVPDEIPMSRNLLQEAAFELGQPGCDNKIAYIMHSYGYTVTNPCFSVEIIHLQSGPERSYDPKADKLLGLHAFVYPTKSILEPSYLEFNLLTRNLNDFMEIQVNRWINDLPSYRLAADSNKMLKSHLPSSPPEKLHRKFFSENLSPNFSCIQEGKKIGKVSSLDNFNKINHALDIIELNNFQLNHYEELHRFSDRFRLYMDGDFYYIYDAEWPYIKKIIKHTWSDLNTNTKNIQLFLRAYVPTVLEFENLSIRDTMDYPEDIYFWQYPCRTEADATIKHKCKSHSLINNQEVNIYVSLPWATFIDKKNFPLALISLMGRRVKAIRDSLFAHRLKLKVHTVCQHIHYKRDLYPYLEMLGVTDLWTSHKTYKNDHIADIKLHSWPLYAVNYREPSRSIGLIRKPIQEKKYLASFVGAYMGHYLSKIRLDLMCLKNKPGFFIDINDEWHFNNIVYDHQVLAKQAVPEDRSHEVLRYNQILSDSVFSLCPSGAGPNSLRLWESLAIGSIPVILSDDYELPDLHRFPSLEGYRWSDALIIHPEAKVQDLELFLKSISSERLSAMQEIGKKIYAEIEEMTCF